MILNLEKRAGGAPEESEMMRVSSHHFNPKNHLNNNSTGNEGVNHNQNNKENETHNNNNNHNNDYQNNPERQIINVPGSPSSPSSENHDSAGVGNGNGWEGWRNGNSSGYDSWNRKSRTGFVGLSNQGATCYMNSLIQALYMSPEFRSAVYEWDFDDSFRMWREKKRMNESEESNAMEIDVDDDAFDVDVIEREEAKIKSLREKESIPRQLQLLFARLQMMDVRAVKTKPLTRSFGWTDLDAFTQHDVQELCRVLFDALEKAFSGTAQSGLINELYEGEMKDYVRCLNCNRESSRADKFLDIPLVIKGFGETKPVESADEALRKFIAPETLVHPNQYFCEKCDMKCNAVKGLKFTKFPYLLTFQLKRFDFDYDAQHRIKLNDPVSFPLIFDMNQFLDCEDEGDDTVDANGDTPGDSSTPASKRRKTEDEDISKLPLDEQIERLQRNGPYVYELYAILIHRGSAIGGHYFAYIKDFNGQQWYEFNDSFVDSISPEKIKETFGEKPKRGGLWSYFQSTATAYMLLYRRLDPERNIQPGIEIPITEKVRQAILDEEELSKKKEQEREREAEMVECHIYLCGTHAAVNAKRKREDHSKLLKLHNSTTIKELKEKCLSLWELSAEDAMLELTRLRSYNSRLNIPLEPHHDLEKTLYSFNCRLQANFVLEMRADSLEAFPEYDPTQLTLKIITHLQGTSFSDPIPFNIRKGSYVQDLVDALISQFPDFSPHQFVVEKLHSYYSKWNLIEKSDFPRNIQSMGISNGTTIFIERSDNDSVDSPSVTEIERRASLIAITFTVPDDPGASHTLTVPNTMTFGDLKQLIADEIGIPVNEFIVKKGPVAYKTEMEGDERTLFSHCVYSNTTLYIEKGTPQIPGELRVKLFFFDPSVSNQLPSDSILTTSLQGENSILECKQVISERLKSLEPPLDIPPDRMRLRHFSHSPGSVFRNDISLKSALQMTYWKRILISPLKGPESVTDKRQICVFIQQFHPDKYELGPLEELTLTSQDSSYYASYSDLAPAISAFSSIDPADLKILRSYHLNFDLSEIKSAFWREITSNTTSSYYYASDGDLIIYRDKQIPTKQLTEEEEKKLKREAASRKNNQYKEEALVIHQKE